MFKLFRRNCLYNDSIEPHCAYCSHCKRENEYQGVCDFRGIVAMAGSCRRFEYDALRRRPPKPARIRGRFTDADFFFEENNTQPSSPFPKESEKSESLQKPLISDDLSQFADLWEDDDDLPDENAMAASAKPSPAEASAEPQETEGMPTESQENEEFPVEADEKSKKDTIEMQEDEYEM